jgi:hypothetical protein
MKHSPKEYTITKHENTQLVDLMPPFVVPEHGEIVGSLLVCFPSPLPLLQAKLPYRCSQKEQAT